MPTFVSMQTKGVGKSPVFDLLQGRALRFTEQDSILPKASVVHVAAINPSSITPLDDIAVPSIATVHLSRIQTAYQ